MILFDLNLCLMLWLFVDVMVKMLNVFVMFVDWVLLGFVEGW